MTIVYVVTSGCYSEYHIKKVFLDEEKAKLYATTDCDAMVEEYEVIDAEELGIYRVVSAEIEVFPAGDKYTDVTHWVHSEMDISKTASERSVYFDCLNKGYNRREYLRIVRVIPDNLTDDLIEAKYTRIIEDLYAQVRSLIDLEGWTSDMIEEWLADKGRWGETEVSA